MRLLVLLLSVDWALHRSPLAAQASPPQASAPEPTGVLRPGDLVRLRIWREPDLSGDFQVDEQGTVVLPKIGPLSIRELPAASPKTPPVANNSPYLRDPAMNV